MKKEKYKILKLSEKEIETLKHILAKEIVEFKINKNKIEKELENKELDFETYMKMENKYYISKKIFDIINYLER